MSTNSRGNVGSVAISRPRLTLFVSLFFTAVGLANAVQIYMAASLSGEPIGWTNALVQALPFWWVKAALVPLVIMAARQLPPLGAGWWWRAPAHFVFSLLFAAIPLVVGGTLIVTLYPQYGPLGAAFGQLFSSFFVAGVSIYWLLLAAVHALEYYERYREHELQAARLEQRSSQLEASLATARLAALRMQVNPHFLYNTLNSVSVLAMRGEGQRVARMLDELAGMLRLTLERTDRVVSLDEELELLDRYLRIEQVRFEDRLRVRRSISPAARRTQVPSLLLQPLVENALKHGVGATPGPVEVEIAASVEDGRTRIRVRDSGPGFTRSTERGSGLGLKNTRLRLQAIYGDDASLTLSAPGRGAEVRIDLPFVVDEAWLERAADGHASTEPAPAERAMGA
jgi:two-component system, LytTR family, sensor kinase